ncbi:MAG: RNA polymerase sigma factor [Deltaproteobacteria bacterium]|nr:RNA polymerase sigma factor [Deltaproteobacteria bacterium]
MADDLSEVYQREFEHVWRTLRRFGVREAHLEDVAQEVFLVVHRRLPDFDKSRPIRPWLTGIAFKVAADHRGKASVRREHPSDHELEVADERPPPDELMIREEKRRLVHRALAMLDDDKRAAFIMHDLDGHTVPEIARALEVPLNTVYSRLRLARERFVRAIAELRKGDAP